MTKYTTLDKTEKLKAVKTVFRLMVSSDLEIIDAPLQPNKMDEVLFLGNDEDYGDVFLAYADAEDKSEFAIYFGEKGTEFND